MGGLLAALAGALNTLRSDTRRYTFTTTPNVVDLGLRLDDVEALGLASESVTYKGRRDPRGNLRECGATEAECAFLVREQGRQEWLGQRVEINAMTSRQLVDWLEATLRAHGVGKVVPERDVLEQAYRRASRLATIQWTIDRVNAAEAKKAIRVPANLAKRVRAEMAKQPTVPWDTAVWKLARARSRRRSRPRREGT